MHLHDVLHQIASVSSLNAEELIAFAAEDQIGGRDTTYPTSRSSIDGAEGQLLYALIRALKPARVLEIGVFDGVSSLHLLTALRANATGELVSLDIDEAAGKEVPDDLRSLWTLRIEDALTAELPAADLIFEDSDHGLEPATAMLGKIKALAPHIVISHDYYSHEVYGGGFYVKQAFDAVFGEPNVIGIRFDGAERGFGLWINPDWKAPEAVEVPAKKSRRKAAK